MPENNFLKFTYDFQHVLMLAIGLGAVSFCRNVSGSRRKLRHEEELELEKLKKLEVENQDDEDSSVFSD